MNTAEKRPTLEEVPVDKLNEVAQVHAEVLLYFRRQNLKGSIESLPSRQFPTAELLTDGVEAYLREVHGGGAYIIEVRNTALHTEELVPRYRITILGPPRALAMAPGGGHLSERYAPAPSQNEVASAYRFTGAAPGAVGGNRPSDFMSHTPDQIALDQVAALREELRQVRREAADKERKANSERELTRQKLEDARLATERAQSESRDNALKAQIESLRELVRQPQAPAKPTFDLSALAAVMAAIVPVLVAMISSGKDKQQLQLNAQQHANDQQMNMLLTLMKKDDGGKSGLDLVVGLLPKLLEANNPSKMADVIASMGESQMATLSMAAQAIQALAPPEDTPGMMIVKTALEGAMGIADQFAQRSQPQQQRPQLQQQRAPQQLHAVSQPQQQEAQAEVVPTPQQGAQPRRQRPAPGGAQQPQGPGQVVVPRTPRELALAIVADLQWPATMNSATWVRLLTTLHTDRDPEDVGGEIGMMLEGMMNIGELAEVLHPMFEDDGPAPSELLRPIFERLPIAQPAHAAHYEAVLAAIDASYDATPAPVGVSSANGVEPPAAEQDTPEPAPTTA